MKSVDALRKWADGLRGIWINPNDHSIIVTTCDDMPPSIDCVNLREHVNAILDNIEREAADMVPLPLDADGVPIHIGDVMEWPYGNGEFRVNGIGGNTLFYIDKDSGECEWTAAGDKRHHHAPTVEDVLREFAHVGIRIAAKHGIKAGEVDFYADEDAIAEFASKLRLAEGADA